MSRRSSWARSARASKNPVRDLIEDLFSLYFGRFFLGSLDSVIAARTDRRLARHIHPIVAHYHAAMRAAWTKALAEAGYGRAAADDKGPSGAPAIKTEGVVFRQHKDAYHAECKAALQ